MKFDHTPGPWEVLPEEVDREYIRVRGTNLGGRFKIANVINGAPGFGANETRANARLIAAAPGMLDALIQMARHLASSGSTASYPYSNMINKIEEASGKTWEEVNK